MTTDRIDLGREYFAGMNTPTAEQVGNRVRVAEFPDADVSINLEYPALCQVLTASGAWDGSAESVHVRGSGARTITIEAPGKVGWRLRVVDALGNAAGGTITIDPDGSGTINGASTLALTTNYATAELECVDVDTNAWVRVA